MPAFGRTTFRTALAAASLALLAAAAGCASGGRASPPEAWDGDAPPVDGFVDQEEAEAPAETEGPAADGDGDGDADGEAGDGDGEVAPAEDGEASDDGAAGCTTHEECDDGIDCTTDACDPATGTCKHEPSDDLCNDGDPCNGQESCDEVRGCVPGIAAPCDDGIDCTEDLCDPLTAACRSVAVHARCVPPQICDPAEGGCVDPPACVADGDCGDGDPCNGTETCGPDLVCVPGTPVVCDDGIDCTVDACNPLTGTCSSTPNDAACSDGDLCNGAETCAAGSGCVAGTAVDCDDGVNCTADSCAPLTGRCRNAADDALCDDHVFCNGQERCDSREGCVAAEAPTCDDHVPCTQDRCDAGRDECVNTPVDASCSDGQLCNGEETCLAAAGCVSGLPPRCSDGLSCTTDRCDPDAAGGAGACVHVAPDRDGDTFADRACTGTDCDDIDPLVNPDAAETCNAVDDDCDDDTDETYTCVRGTTMSCSTTCGSAGTQTCSNTCNWAACVPPAETCNGFDDDCLSGCDNGWECCRGATQEQGCGFCGTQTRTCASGCAWGAWSTCGGSGECAAGTTETRGCLCGGSENRICSSSCTWGAWSGCTLGACTPDDVQDCSTSCGSTGTQTCSAACAWGSCVPPAETCNGLDDDCVLGCDNGSECCRGQTQTQSCGLCASQTRTCSAGCTWGSWGTCMGGGECSPGATETRSCTCGGTENRTCGGDCIWGAWSGCASGECTPSATRSCTTGCGSTGTQVCSPSCTWGPCAPPAETCNGFDDDCVSGCDNGWECCRGQTQTQSCGFCGTQSRTCGTACSWGSWSACGGEGVCSPGTTETRSCACGGTESRTCSPSCTWGAWSGCASGACTPGATQSCTTSCSSTGTQTCSPSCTWGACVPPAETCNGADDDCVSGCDNGWACCRGATETQSCGWCGTGSQSRTCGSACTWGSWSTCVGGGACEPGSTMSCNNSCGVAGTQTCSGGCSWGACCAPSEVCGNTCDDDCDGTTNEGCPTVPNDTCSSPTVISLGQTYSGSITGAAHNYSGSCGTTSGPDVVYQLSHPGGDLFVGVVSTAFNPTVYLSTSCGSSSQCNDNAYAGVNASVLILSGLASGTYYVVVDSPAGSSGDFTIETYRDGNYTAGDMCGEPLRLYNGVSGDTCESWVWDDYTPSCQSWDSYEIVYYFVKETAASSVTVSSCGSSYDSVLYLRTDCDNGGDLACNDDDGPSCSGTRASFRADSVGPGIYFVFMDGWDDGLIPRCGTFTLYVSGI